VFWEECQAFKHVAEDTAKVEHIRNIIDRFIDASSPLELNLENKPKHARTLLDAIQRYEQYAESITPACLHEMEILVRKDMIDLFARFENTSEYAGIRKSMQSQTLLKQKTMANISFEAVVAIESSSTLPV
jgi:hypothetical protein